MARKKIETIVKEKISPYTLNERGIADLAQHVRQYPYELLLECIDIGVASYFQYDKEGNLIRESVQTFLNKLGGIAYNKSRSPVDQEIYHLKTKEKANLHTGIRNELMIFYTNMHKHYTYMVGANL